MKKVGIAYDDRNLFATEHQVTNAVFYARRLLLQKSLFFFCFLVKYARDACVHVRMSGVLVSI